MNELEAVKKQPLGDYVGKISKNKRDGQGGLRLLNGDVYKGGFKNDKRHGTGICQFASGAIYRGDWRDDNPNGQGILFSGSNEVIEGRFENGAAPHGRVKIMFSDGSYYEGSYSNHRRHGQGVMIYPNGEEYAGEWNNDKRIGRGKMQFLNKTTYKGQFIDDQADGDGQIEDQYNNFFQVEQAMKDDGSDAGCILNGRLSGRCSISFQNGDYFIGEFKEGRPNGQGEMYYKHSLPSTQSGVEFEQGHYKGEFRLGKRHGKGTMVWSDGSVFDGDWLNDERAYGKMIMRGGWVYEGAFKDDKFHGDNEKLMTPDMLIYQGRFEKGRTCNVGMILYENGDVYYGQLRQTERHGYGKLIQYNGGFKEGCWEQDKLSGKQCRIFDATSGDIYIGPIEEDKKVGRGIYYDKERDEVYEGDYENDKRQGEGTLFRRNGEVLKGDFRNNYMEGSFDKVVVYTQAQINKIFDRCKIQSTSYIAVNKKNHDKVQEKLNRTMEKGSSMIQSKSIK